MELSKILVTGGNGQLGSCLRKLSSEFESDYDFFFTDSTELDITDNDAVESFFKDCKPNYCINASAYTAVDLAEQESEKAFQVNAEGVANLAEACKKYNCTFIHVSTDYVFNGDTQLPYSEDNFTDPQGVYGKSKLAGEEAALEIWDKTIILRTSWLYSEFNKNFVKTMLHLFTVKDKLGVVADQFGQPTNANDLAEAIMKIIETNHKNYGVFHFSNYPETSWFDFASKIAELNGNKIKIDPIKTVDYPTPAKRPARSTMALDKIEEFYGIEPKHWEHSLEECILQLNTQEKK